MATRMRTYDMLAHRQLRRAPAARTSTAWRCGAARPSTCRMRFLHRRSVGAAAAAARSDPEHLFPDAVARVERGRLHGVSGQRGARVRRRGGRAGHRHLPHLRLAQLAAEHEGGDGGGARRPTQVCEAAICYTGDILDPKRDKYSLAYYVDMAKELEKMGAHILAIKDMAGLLQAVRGRQAGEGAARGDRHADPLPHARHQRA